MREVIKVVWVVIFLAAATAAALTWNFDRPTPMVWVWRIALSVLSLFAICVVLKMHFRADIVPDYLRRVTRGYFNRSGFCFSVGADAVDGVCFLVVYFQNQHENSCVGQIALRPARGFFLVRKKMDTMAIEVLCAPAAFGAARIAIPVPAKLQGRRQSFEVGASVHFPNGKGRQLRFRTGIALRANSNFGDTFGAALTVAGALTGQVVLSTPATIKIKLPVSVAEEVPNSWMPEIKTLCKLGDPHKWGFQTSS